MSQPQPMRDQQAQSGTTAPAFDSDHVQYPEVPSSGQKVEGSPVGDQVNGPANDQGRPLGTEVMGDPAKPVDQQTMNFDADSKTENQRGEQFVGGEGQNPPAAGNPYVQQPASTNPANQQAQEFANSPSQQTQGVQNPPAAGNSYVQQPASTNPANQQAQEFANPPSQQTQGEQNPPAAGNPYVQQPASTTPANQQAQEFANSPSQQTQGANPYVQTTSTENFGKGPMDNLQQAFASWSKGFTGNAGNVWTHLSTGPNMTETALGRLSVGTKLLSGGGLVNVFKREFPPVSDNEQLLKTYACYLSTSTGPVAGTLFISTEKVAFGSDRPLSSSPQSGGRPQAGVEQPKHFYKVAIPLDKVQATNPRENPKKVSEKYIQVETTDQHEFWFMGFVNYDKAVKNLQEAVNGTHTNMQQNVSDSPEAVTDSQTNVQPNANPSSAVGS